MDDASSPTWEVRLREHLALHGLRLTQQRLAIASAFFSTAGHPDIEELAGRVRRRHPHIGLATVYRTLKLLVDSGLADASRFGGAAQRFEARAAGEHHDHLVCTACGSLVEFVDEAIEGLQEKVAQAHGFQISHHTMEIYGRCRACAAREG